MHVCSCEVQSCMCVCACVYMCCLYFRCWKVFSDETFGFETSQENCDVFIILCEIIIMIVIIIIIIIIIMITIIIIICIVIA